MAERVISYSTPLSKLCARILTRLVDVKEAFGVHKPVSVLRFPGFKVEKWKHHLLQCQPMIETVGAVISTFFELSNYSFIIL